MKKQLAEINFLRPIVIVLLVLKYVVYEKYFICYTLS